MTTRRLLCLSALLTLTALSGCRTSHTVYHAPDGSEIRHSAWSLFADTAIPCFEMDTNGAVRLQGYASKVDAAGIAATGQLAGNVAGSVVNAVIRAQPYPAGFMPQMPQYPVAIPGLTPAPAPAPAPTPAAAAPESAPAKPAKAKGGGEK